MDTATVINCEVALLDLHAIMAERKGHTVEEMFAEIRQSSAAFAASEAGL